MSRAANAPSAGAIERLDDDRDSLADADAQGGEAVPATSRAQRVHEVDEDARSAHPEWMPDRDRASVDVDPVGIDPELPDHGQRLRRKRLVQLDEVEIAHLQLRAVERLARRGHRPD